MSEVPIWLGLAALAFGPGGALGVALIFVNKRVNGALDKLDALASVPTQLKGIDAKLDRVCQRGDDHSARLSAIETRCVLLHRDET